MVNFRFIDESYCGFSDLVVHENRWNGRSQGKHGSYGLTNQVSIRNEIFRIGIECCEVVERLLCANAFFWVRGQSRG